MKVDAMPMRLVVLPVALVDGSISSCEPSSSMRLVCGPLAFVARALPPDVHAFSVTRCAHPFAGVHVAIAENMRD
eukprot:CAMPEP_0169113268 /NCGR_PEP_ID=MMETSP1015-20121227/28110_1 /TAXON_ID=342587 /ORGANISM="Karlodinium micrum, Strain CCMP2283" /LENGTH=74 /DNA_ID=CAMNT_0009175425 /DNA_START=496 /DNA_END=720 /DNA_ORIENTATION=+